METVDISSLFPLESGEHPSAGSIRAIAPLIHEQFTRLGFLYLSGADACVSAGTINSAFIAAQAFFDSDEQTKATAFSRDRARRGYSPLLTENFGSLAGTVTPNDSVEKFRVGPFHFDSSDPYYTNKHARTLFFPNTWPESTNLTSVNMRATIEGYYSAMEKLAQVLLRVFEEALGVPSGFFEQHISEQKHTSVLSLNHYPPASHHFVHEGADTNTITGPGFRVAAHTDVSVFTIVCQSGGEDGLELLTRDGCWMPVRPKAGCFIVNAGDCLMRWTNGAWVSTTHRVSFPSVSHSPAHESSRSGEVEDWFEAPPGHRYSLVYFVGANYDAVIDPSQLLPHEQQPRTPCIPVTYAQWRRERVRDAMESLRASSQCKS